MNKNTKKRSLGQFFTKNHFWLKPHIIDFIKSTNKNTVLDPFAGEGDLLKTALDLGLVNTIGFDIDETLPWEKNDSLINIPRVQDAIIITNPPYLTNYSAKRKKIFPTVKKYFDICPYDDLYQLALEKCFENNDFGVVIIPETFINSKFPKNRILSITVIEDLMFNDTENPICVVCFDNKYKNYNEIKIYKNDKYINTLGELEKFRKKPQKDVKMRFNSVGGQIALRAVDTTTPGKVINFMRAKELVYNRDNIKVSSRLITLIELEVDEKYIDKIIKNSNQILLKYRENTSDLLLSPFKGNTRDGIRRRRLDYKTARAILEESINMINPSSKLF